VWNPSIRAVELEDSTLDDINGIIDDSSEYSHSALPSTICLCLPPYLLGDDRAEVYLEVFLRLCVEDMTEFFFGEECFFVTVV
jgi:hypothetical protein